MISIALDFCSLQRTLASDGINPDVLARCEAEVQRLERQFHESMVFLLRVSRADFDRISTCPKNVGASVSFYLFPRIARSFLHAAVTKNDDEQLMSRP